MSFNHISSVMVRKIVIESELNNVLDRRAERISLRHAWRMFEKFYIKVHYEKTADSVLLSLFMGTNEKLDCK